MVGDDLLTMRLAHTIVQIEDFDSRRFADNLLQIPCQLFQKGDRLVIENSLCINLCCKFLRLLQQRSVEDRCGILNEAMDLLRYA